MPRAPRICATAGCTNTQPCATHAKVPWQGSHSRGFPTAVRRYILERDPICRHCGQRPSAVADHIVPVAFGGSHDPDLNGQGLCTTCDRTKTAHDATQGRQRATRRDPGGPPPPPLGT